MAWSTRARARAAYAEARCCSLFLTGSGMDLLHLLHRQGDEPGRCKAQQRVVGGRVDHVHAQPPLSRVRRLSSSAARAEGTSSTTSIVCLRGEYQVDNSLAYSPVTENSMGLAPGGRMRQEIYDDPYGLDAWDQRHASRCFVSIVNSRQWRAITGRTPAYRASHRRPVRRSWATLVRILQRTGRGRSHRQAQERLERGRPRCPAGRVAAPRESDDRDRQRHPAGLPRTGVQKRPSAGNAVSACSSVETATASALAQWQRVLPAT